MATKQQKIAKAKKLKEELEKITKRKVVLKESSTDNSRIKLDSEDKRKIEEYFRAVELNFSKIVNYFNSDKNASIYPILDDISKDIKNVLKPQLKKNFDIAV